MTGERTTKEMTVNLIYLIIGLIIKRGTGEGKYINVICFDNK